jgi:hypothetical protein
MMGEETETVSDLNGVLLRRGTLPPQTATPAAGHGVAARRI